MATEVETAADLTHTANATKLYTVVVSTTYITAKYNTFNHHLLLQSD